MEADGRLPMRAIKVLARWDFLSYPERYPSQSRAAMRPLGIGWVHMSRHGDHPLPASFTHWAGVDPEQSVASGSFPASNPGLRYGSALHDERISGDGRDKQCGSDDRGSMVPGNGGGEEQH
jgi:hypothetical protein